MPLLTPRVLLALFLGALALAALAGCETVVDVNVPEHERQLVPQGFFAPESLWVVRVSHSVGYTEPTRPGLVEDAMVEIRADGERLEPLVRRDSWTYVGVGHRPVPGQTYTLRVTAPGFDDVEATATLPFPPEVVAFEAYRGESPAPGRRTVRLRLTLDDPPGVPNRYTLALLHLRVLLDPANATVTPLPPALFPFTSADDAFDAPLPNPLDPDDPTFLQALLRDDGFDGQRRTLDAEFEVDAPAAPGAGPTVQRAFVVLFASLSEELYRYAETAPEQAVFGDNPFGEPLRVYSNVSNGFGVFAGFSPRAFPIPPDSLLAPAP